MFWLILLFQLGLFGVSTADAAQPTPPKMTPELFPAVMERHEVVVQLARTPSSGPGRDFRIFCAFHVRTPLDRARRGLLDFQSYRRLSTALNQVRYEPRRHLLWATGSILTLHFKAVMKIEERSQSWVHFSAVLDEHRSLPADLFLKPVRLAGRSDETLVYLTGILHSDSVLIPDVTITKAADLLLTSVAVKMREKIESSRSVAGEPPEFSQVQERRPELIWAKSLDVKVRDSLVAYQQHRSLPNGVAYGSVIRTLRLDQLCSDEIAAWAKKRQCTRKNDVIKKPDSNEPILIHGSTIPLVEFLCKDGGVIRLKPQGDPTSAKNPAPNAIKAMRFFGSDRYENFGDEAFKVDNAGLPIPKWPKDLNTELPEMTERTRSKYVEDWAKDAHTPLKACR